jgi:catechol 2,3-dioxygenase-like lactoylglutathione lyase family enzyme
MKTKLDHVSLFTKDLDRSLVLFRDLLGFEKVWQVGPLGGKAMAALFGVEDIKAELLMLQSKSGASLELIHLLEPSLDKDQMPSALPAPAFLCLEVEDLESLCQGVTRNGWQPLAAISKMPTPAGEMISMFCIRTEENVLLEFIEKLSA